MDATEKTVFVDIETGGLEPTRPIMQIAAIAVDSSLRELETFEVKIRFRERDASPYSLRKRSYNRELWNRCGRKDPDAARMFAAFLRRHATVDLFSGEGGIFQVAQLVAHNATFDGPFLLNWYEKLGLFLPAAYRSLCTVQRAVWLFHEHTQLTPPADYKLGTLCQYFGVPLRPEEAHEAMADVRATVDLYRAIMDVSRSIRSAEAA